jgi:hypothetical protein
MKTRGRFYVITAAFALIAPIFVSAPAQAALGVSAITSSPIQSTGGGGAASVICDSPRVVSSISSYSFAFDGTSALSQTTASCATLAADGLTISATGSQTLGPYGASSSGSATTVACSTNGGSRVLVGARVYKTANGYTSGVQLNCGTLPNGGSRSYEATVIGATSASTEELTCNTGSVVVGLNLRHGGILDTFGMNCAALTGSGQNITISTLGTSSKTYPYSQALSMSTTGSLGSGAITYSISAGGTATSCALSNATNTATITAASNGTCFVKATIAAGGGYESGTSQNATFTFNKAAQSALSLSSLSGSFGTPLTLTTSGGSGGGSVSYVYAAGTTTCSLSGSTLTANDAGTCLITATKAADANYSLVTASQATVTFGIGITTATITFAPGNLVFRQPKLITVVASAAGLVTFRVAGKVLPGCKNKVVSNANLLTTTCSYKPSNRNYVKVTATLVPTSASLTGVVSESAVYLVGNRTGTR